LSINNLWVELHMHSAEPGCKTNITTIKTHRLTPFNYDSQKGLFPIMKLSNIICSLAAMVSFTAAQRTFNLTAALAPGQLDRYRCLDTNSWIKRVPKCLQQCTINANLADGCAFDDFACHCINYQVYSDVCTCVASTALLQHIFLPKCCRSLSHVRSHHR
jgi:hypothetical protein